MEAGYSPYFAFKTFEMLYNDIFHNKNFTLKEKLWAHRRGFLTRFYALNHLTDQNYKDYLSFSDYYKLHPINGIFSRWIDDKLTIRYLLDPFLEYLPQYYYHFYRGELLKSLDCPRGYEKNIEDVIKLLKSKKLLAVKLLSGSAGQGFIKLSYEKERIAINDESVQEHEIKEVLKGWLHLRHSGYLITEFIKPCEQLTKIWENTSNSLRVLIIRNKNRNPMIAESFIRFGTNKSGVVDNADAGGVACLINPDNGTFSRGIIGKEYYQEIELHPDTHQPLRGIIPNWTLIKNKIIEISAYIPQVICLGFDIIVTNAGFKIIEINSHPGIYQHNTPFLKNEITKDFYQTLIDRKNKGIEHRKNQRFPKRFIERILNILES